MTASNSSRPKPLQPDASDVMGGALIRDSAPTPSSEVAGVALSGIAIAEVELSSEVA